MRYQRMAVLKHVRIRAAAMPIDTWPHAVHSHSVGMRQSCCHAEVLALEVLSAGCCQPCFRVCPECMQPALRPSPIRFDVATPSFLRHLGGPGAHTLWWQLGARKERLAQ